MECTLIAESTQDSSKLESAIIIACYIEGLLTRKTCSVCCIQIDFVTLKELTLTRFQLFKQTIVILKGHNLEVTIIVGQNYNTATN